MPDFTTYHIAMIIQDIYDQYHIPHTLQQHMLRVAWVCKKILDNRKDITFNKEEIVTAALLHDMWNIVKFDLDNIPPELEDMYKELDVKELRIAQTKIISLFGSEEHTANMGIAKEIWASNEVVEIIGKINFTRLKNEHDTYTIPQIIVKYWDLRVWPYGIISVAERLREAAIRYNKSDWMQKTLQENIQFVQQVEENIFSHCTLSPQDITDENINPLLEDLRGFDIVTTLWTS